MARIENPVKYPSAADCPSFFDHTPHPPGYIEHHAWMRKMMKTHKQVRCTRCGYWSICEPRGVSSLTPEKT